MNRRHALGLPWSHARPRRAPIPMLDAQPMAEAPAMGEPGVLDTLYDVAKNSWTPAGYAIRHYESAQKPPSTPTTGFYAFNGYLYLYGASATILEVLTPAGPANKQILKGTAKWSTLYGKFKGLKPISNEDARAMRAAASAPKAAPATPAPRRRPSAPVDEPAPYMPPPESPPAARGALDVINDNATMIAGGAAALGVLLLLASALRRPRAAG